MMRKNFIFLSGLILLLICLKTEATVVSNPFINLYSYEKGKYRIYNGKGNLSFKTDDNQQLLYPGETTVSSVFVDGKHYFYGEETGRFVQKPQKQGQAIVSIWEVDQIQIKQTLSIVKNSESMIQDTVLISYEAVNTDTADHQVGIRIMLDTLLGSNDGAAFKVPGFGNVLTEVMIFDKAIPNFWYCYDDFKNPKIISKGTLAEEDVVKPDRVVFGSWQKLKAIPWNFVERKGSSFSGDTAVALYYDPVKVEPGKNIKVSTKYGVLGCKIDIKGSISLMLNEKAIVKKPPF
ncbi:MAG: hypothetical protein CVU04_05765, partial [Bacteroidetes bacterium HGW-Bacteroidetes-20]